MALGQSRDVMFFVRTYSIVCLLISLMTVAAPAQDHRNRIRIDPPVMDTAEMILALIDSTGQLVQANRPDSAYPLLNRLLLLSRAVNNTHGITSAYTTLGICYTVQGLYPQANRVFREALKTSDERNLGRLYSNMALPYYYQGKYDSAALYWYQAIEEHLQPDLRTLAGSYANLADIMIKFEKYDMALQYLNYAEQVSRKSEVPIPMLQAHILMNRGNIYEKTGNVPLARKYYLEALQLGRQSGYAIMEQEASVNLGKLALRDDNPREALVYLQSALSMGDDQTPYHSIVQPYLHMGRAYTRLHQYAQAEDMLQKALEKADRHNMGDHLHEIHEALAHLYAETGRFPEAYAHHRLFHEHYELLTGNRKDQALNQLEIRYRIAEKNKEIAQRDSRIKEKNIWILGISSGALLLTATLALVWSLYRNNRHKQYLLAEKLTNLQREHEIKQLKAMMEGEERERVRIAQDLHDGIVVQFAAAKMNLSSLPVQHTGLQDSPEFHGVLRQLESATRELRETAHNLLPDILLQEGIPDAVFYFCKSMEQHSGLKIRFQIYGQVPRFDPDFELSVYRIVQELVHNMIKHARATRALVQINYQDDLLSITVEDNGRGIPENALEQGKGIGLKNIRNRVAAMKGLLDIVSTPETGTICYLEFHTTAYMHKQ